MPLITFEGIDGAGKSEQLRITKEFLEANGREVYTYREPGGTIAGDMAREILLTGEGIHPVAQLMLFQFSRAQLVHTVVKPLLDKDSIVLMDRFVASTMAYQGYAQSSETSGLDSMTAWNACMAATGGIKPDMEIYLEVDLDVAYRRMENAGKELDNFEKSRSFMQAVLHGYDAWYGGMCNYPFVRINANEGANDINRHVLDAVWTNGVIK